MNEQQLTAWLTLSFTPKLGGVALSKLMSVDSPENLIQYSSLQWQKLGLKPNQIHYIQNLAAKDVEQCLKWKEESSSHFILTPLNSAYPNLVRQMSSHPPVLFVKGNVAVLTSPQLAIVGSRHASLDGLQAAKDFSFQLANQGITITSGLALGIDGHAHDGALRAEGKTIAVLGSGVDQIYPVRHAKLAERIVQQGGAILSEFRPWAQPRSEHFPRRNRIISGLSLGVLVVEAAEKSGSLITARYALEQNRDVFALPGSIYQAGFAGSNRLLQQGAILALSPQDILDEIQSQLSLSFYSTFDKNSNQTQLNLDQQPESNTQSDLLETLPFPELFANVGSEPTPVDILAERTHIPVHEVMMQLLELELSGYIISVSGGYVRKHNPK
ncbi:MAG: DNA-processing protein DprA [Vibrio sp.]